LHQKKALLQEELFRHNQERALQGRVLMQAEILAMLVLLTRQDNQAALAPAKIIRVVVALKIARVMIDLIMGLMPAIEQREQKSHQIKQIQNKRLKRKQKKLKN